MSIPPYRPNNNSHLMYDISSLPLPMNYQPVQANDLPPPSDLPPMLPADIRMQQLRERADNLGMTKPAVSRDINREVEALAKQQGYTFDKNYHFYTNGNDIKTVEDFIAEFSSKDDTVAKVLELKLILERKQKEADQQEALTLQFLKNEEVKPANRPLADHIIKELESEGWILNDEGQFASHPNGDFKLYDAIKQESDVKKLANADIKPANRPLADHINKELESSGWILDDEGLFASHPNDGMFLTYEQIKQKFS